MAEKPQLADRFAPADFFVVRTPLLPFDEVFARQSQSAAGTDREQLRERMRKLFSRPEVREALLLASPSLHETYRDWHDDPSSTRGIKAEPALVRYLIRMAGRATPFGLFAGCSVGRVNNEQRGSAISIAPLAEYRRHTRLDMEYLCSLVSEIERRPEIRRELRFHTNSSLYRAADRWRYAEARGAGRARSYQLVAIDDCPYLRAVLDRAAIGGTPAELATALEPLGIEADDALAFVEELIDNQLLTSDLEPAVTGGDALTALVTRLAKIPAAREYHDILNGALRTWDRNRSASRVKATKHSHGSWSRCQ
jgi:hypothetical protein